MKNIYKDDQKKVKNLKPDFSEDVKDVVDETFIESNFLDIVVQISSVAWTTIANIAVGIFIGYWLDNFFGSQPFFIIVFSILGVFASIYYLYNFSRKV